MDWDGGREVEGEMEYIIWLEGREERKEGLSEPTNLHHYISLPLIEGCKLSFLFELENIILPLNIYK